MSWQAIALTLQPEVQPESEALDLLSGALFESGAQGLEIKDTASPIEVIVYVALEEGIEASTDAWLQTLQAAGHPVASAEALAVPEVDWATHWRAHFQPIKLGPVLVLPSWLDPPEGEACVLRIEPSMAFGTGLHATTSLCAERVAELAEGCTALLDVGTGTGILAMIGLLTGAAEALGIDNDPDAVRVAEENREANGFDARLALAETPLAEIEARYPLVVANILAAPLVEMAPMLAARVAPGGRLLLSGVLSVQAEAVEAAYVKAGLTPLMQRQRDEWSLIELKREAD